MNFYLRKGRQEESHLMASSQNNSLRLKALSLLKLQQQGNNFVVKAELILKKYRDSKTKN
ncbi:MAG: hypothetical protein ACTHML_17745 [Ginsengibacter sp.]